MWLLYCGLFAFLLPWKEGRGGGRERREDGEQTKQKEKKKHYSKMHKKKKTQLSFCLFCLSSICLVLT
jgi:hypothetical protein